MPKPKPRRTQRHDERRAHLTPPYRCPNCFRDGYVAGSKMPGPQAYIDLLLWTLKWYHDSIETVMPDTSNKEAADRWVREAGRDLHALMKKYGK